MFYFIFTKPKTIIFYKCNNPKIKSIKHKIVFPWNQSYKPIIYPHNPPKTKAVERVGERKSHHPVNGKLNINNPIAIPKVLTGVTAKLEVLLIYIIRNLILSISSLNFLLHHKVFPHTFYFSYFKN